MGRESRIKREREVEFDDGSVTIVYADAKELVEEASLQKRAADLGLIVPRGIQRG
jgi:hypothetical protein